MTDEAGPRATEERATKLLDEANTELAATYFLHAAEGYEEKGMLEEALHAYQEAANAYDLDDRHEEAAQCLSERGRVEGLLRAKPQGSEK